MKSWLRLHKRDWRRPIDVPDSQADLHALRCAGRQHVCASLGRVVGLSRELYDCEVFDWVLGHCGLVENK